MGCVKIFQENFRRFSQEFQGVSRRYIWSKGILTSSQGCFLQQFQGVSDDLGRFERYSQRWENVLKEDPGFFQMI